MAQRRLSTTPEIQGSEVENGDKILILDKSDTTNEQGGPEGTWKQVSKGDVLPNLKGNTPTSLVQTPNINWTGTLQEYARIWDAVNSQSLQTIPDGNTIIYRTKRVVYTNFSDFESYTMYINLWLETRKYVPSAVGGITPTVTLGSGGNVTLNSTNSLLTRIEAQTVVVEDGVVTNGVVEDLGVVDNGIADAVDGSGNVYNTVLNNIVFQDDNNDQWLYTGGKDIIGVNVKTVDGDYTFLSPTGVSLTDQMTPFNRTRFVTLADPELLTELSALTGMKYGDSVVVRNYQGNKVTFVYNGSNWEGPIAGGQEGPQGPAGVDGAPGEDGAVLDGERYATLAEVDALTTKSVTVQYIVDADGSNNGYYTWDGTSATVDFNRPLETMVYYNLFDKSTNVEGGYLRNASGLPINQAPINGEEFSISDYIPVTGGNLYTLTGRTTENTESADARAVVFYDASDVKLRPQDIDGNEYPTFSLPFMNGTFKAPDTAVTMRFNSKWYGLPTATDAIQFVEGDIQLKYIAFGVKGRKQTVVVPANVEDGFVMVKRGNSFVGLDPNDIAATEDRPVNDLGYPIYGAIAGTVANFQTLQFEEVNQVPNTGKHLMYYNGDLVFVNEGVITNIF